jgi:hypothetical protein
LALVAVKSPASTRTFTRSRMSDSNAVRDSWTVSNALALNSSVAAAAVLDLLWSVGAYERLVADWDLDVDQATLVIALVDEAVRRGRAPTDV